MCCVVLKRIYIYMYISMIQLYSQCWACVLACSPLALLTSSQQRIKIDFRKNWRWNAYTYNGNGGKKCEWNQNARATTTERKKNHTLVRWVNRFEYFTHSHSRDNELAKMCLTRRLPKYYILGALRINDGNNNNNIEEKKCVSEWRVLFNSIP